MNSRLVHSFSQRRTSLYLEGFNTTYCLFNHSATAHGMVSLSKVPQGCSAVDVCEGRVCRSRFQKSSADGAE